MTTVVSFSEVYSWLSCHRQYYYASILRREPNELSEAMQTGVWGHTLLQDFYRLMAEGKTKEEAKQLMTELASKRVHEASFTMKKALLNAWMLVDNYINATEFKAETIIVEDRFLLPASHLSNDPEMENVQIGFTPDVVFKRTGEFIDVEDSKFVGRAWPQKKINRFPQTKLYQIFLSRMGHVVSRNQIRFFNLKTGQVTTKSYVLKALEEQILIQDFIAGVKEVVRYKEQPAVLLGAAPRTMNYTACQFCHFEVVCSLEAEGKDAEKTLKYEFKERKYDYQR